MPEQLTKVRGAFGDMPTRARYAILGVVLVTILVMFLVVRTATGTEWVPATESLPSAKLGEAQTVLEEAGIENRVSQSGGMIEVPAAEQAKAASKLIPAGIAAKGARAGCAKQSQEGSSLMAKTSAEMDLMLETCREADAANTIESLDGIEKATVDVTVAEDTLFTSEEQPAKASVIVHTGGSSLSKKTVEGIQRTVAGGFKGLDPKSVTVADETGEVIGGDGTDENGNGSLTKLEAEAKLNQRIEMELRTELEKIAGVGAVVLKSNVELDMDEIERAVHNAAAAGENGAQIVKTEITDRELLDGAEAAGVQGVAGTGGQTDVGVDTDNRATTADELATGDDDGDYLADKATREYDNNVIEEAIKVAPGKVMRNRLSVVVDDDVDPASADAVKEFVQAWMGGNAEDSLAFSQAKLAIADAAKEQAGTSVTSSIAGYVKWALLGLGLIGLAFVMRSSLRQRTAELLAPADDLLLLESGDFTPIPIAELEAALAAGEPSAERRTRIEMQRKVEKIAETKPNDVANELRRWMHQDDMAFANNKQRKAG